MLEVLYKWLLAYAIRRLGPSGQREVLGEVFLTKHGWRVVKRIPGNPLFAPPEWLADRVGYECCNVPTAISDMASFSNHFESFPE